MVLSTRLFTKKLYWYIQNAKWLWCYSITFLFKNCNSNIGLFFIGPCKVVALYNHLFLLLSIVIALPTVDLSCSKMKQRRLRAITLQGEKSNIAIAILKKKLESDSNIIILYI